jgi:DNA-binding PadR family transcriptional regulator
MSGPIRVTGPFLDVLEILLGALKDDCELHGWAIAKTARLPGPTVYGIIDRLEDAGWITGRWETDNPQPGKPRRRLYTLTPTGESAAHELLAVRRPGRASRTARPRPGFALMLRSAFPGRTG